MKELQERQEGNNSQLQKREKVFGEAKEYLSNEISTLTAMLNCSKGKTSFSSVYFFKISFELRMMYYSVSETGKLGKLLSGVANLSYH